MWQLITGLAPDTPPESSLSGFARRGSAQPQFWTYGGLLQTECDETSFHERELTQVVAWCMGEF